MSGDSTAAFQIEELVEFRVYILGFRTAFTPEMVVRPIPISVALETGIPMTIDPIFFIDSDCRRHYAVFGMLQFVMKNFPEGLAKVKLNSSSFVRESKSF